MRRKKTDFQRRVNGDVAIEFGDEGMTSYAGLELLIRYLRRIGFNARVRRHLGAVVHGGDFGVAGLVPGDPGAVGRRRPAPASSGVCQG